jgi:hypothetical protein
MPLQRLEHTFHTSRTYRYMTQVDANNVTQLRFKVQGSKSVCLDYTDLPRQASAIIQSDRVLVDSFWYRVRLPGRQESSYRTQIFEYIYICSYSDSYDAVALDYGDTVPKLVRSVDIPIAWYHRNGHPHKQPTNIATWYTCQVNSSLWTCYPILFEEQSFMQRLRQHAERCAARMASPSSRCPGRLPLVV